MDKSFDGAFCRNPYWQTSETDRIMEYDITEGHKTDSGVIEDSDINLQKGPEVDNDAVCVKKFIIPELLFFSFFILHYFLRYIIK